VCLHVISSAGSYSLEIGQKQGHRTRLPKLDLGYTTILLPLVNAHLPAPTASTAFCTCSCSGPIVLLLLFCALCPSHTATHSETQVNSLVESGHNPLDIDAIYAHTGTLLQTPPPINSIQFNLFYIAQYHKIQICLRGLYNLYTYDIPVPGPHIGSGKTQNHSWCHYCSQMPTLQLFVSFLFSLTLFSCSILWGDDKKCHLWSYYLSRFPWQLQQQSDVPLGPGGP